MGNQTRGAKGAKIEQVQLIRRSATGMTYEALYVLKGKIIENKFSEDGKMKAKDK